METKDARYLLMKSESDEQEQWRTLKEFEEALRERGMSTALALLDELKKRDRAKRSIAPAAGGRTQMTAELARNILELHAATAMTQQEIAFRLGVNQGRVNELIKRGKWLGGDPAAPERLSRDRAMVRLEQRARERRASPPPPTPEARPLFEKPKPAADRPASTTRPRALERPPLGLKPRIISAQLAFMDL